MLSFRFDVGMKHTERRISLESTPEVISPFPSIYHEKYVLPGRVTNGYPNTGTYGTLLYFRSPFARAALSEIEEIRTEGVLSKL